jgi:ATP-dependent Clp protease ATP-binding subunit ClpC
METTKPQSFFDSSYFRLPYFERLGAKAILLGLVGCGLVTSIVFISGPLPEFRILGLLGLIFLIETIISWINGESGLNPTVFQQGRSKPVCLNYFIKGKTFSLLDKAFNRAEAQHLPLALTVCLELVYTREIKQGLHRLGINWRELVLALENKIKELSRASVVDGIKEQTSSVRVAELESLMVQSFSEALAANERTISGLAVFLGLFSSKDSGLGEILTRLGITGEDLKNATISSRLIQEIGSGIIRKRGLAAGKFKKTHRIMNRAWTARPTPYLDSLSEDLTDSAREHRIGLLVGHHESYRQMVGVLSRDGRNNSLLVGDEDIGRNTIVEHLAFNIIKDNVPAKLFDRRLVKLDLGLVISGAMTAGEVRERFKKLAEEILKAGNIVLFIPEVHNLKFTVANQEIGGLEILAPIFDAALIPVVGTTTPKLYRSIIETSQTFKDLFEVVQVESLTPAETIQLMIYEAYALEKLWKVAVSYPAIKKIVELANRYFRARPLPRASLDLMQEVLGEAQQRNQKIVLPELVVNLVSRKTNIPLEKSSSTEAKTLLNLENEIHTKLINQDEAVKAVSAALRQYRAGLTGDKKPIASFLFVGPTGVGKTELAKVLSGLYFGSEDMLLRFDMSQYQDKQSVPAFIGSPDSAIAGMLTEAVKRTPFCLILLDEFEKSYPGLLDVFLPVFDEGYLTDSLGEKIDFRNTIIICTSNAHSTYIKDQINAGKTVPEIQDELKNRLTEYFKPELLNRFDSIVAFRQLSKDEIRQIVVLQLNKFKKQILKTQNIELSFSDGVYDLICQLGYDPVFGARPLQGAISLQIKDPLARYILEGKVKKGDSMAVKLEAGDIVFEKQ